MIKQYSKSQFHQRGASLIEALVALFVFSIGAMGLAALQLTSLVSSGESQQRSVVIWKAQDMVDRMRANKGAIAEYVTQVGNSNLNTIGVDSAAGVIQCETTVGFKKPTKICADTKGSNADACTSSAEVAAYDVWDVFCNPNGGLATVGAAEEDDDDAQEGSLGVSNLEIVLRQNDSSSGDPDDDVLLVFEWLSREAEANTNIATTKTIDTDMCEIPNLKVASSLNVYCVRFSL